MIAAWKWFVWAFFGNADDGVIGDASFNPGRVDSWKIRLTWWFRNPAHNWCFYVIGMAGKAFVRTGTYPKDVFSPMSGWNVCVIHYRWLRLPFVSYQGRFVRWYIGWRDRGNFGIKFNIKLGA